MPPIDFKKVCHDYGTNRVLDNIDLGIDENKITTVIGRSGCGKSTLLQMINGLVEPSYGSIYVFNQKIDYRHIDKLRLNIGYSVQGTGLFPHMTVYENITILARILKWEYTVIQKRMERLINLVNLNMNYMKKYPYQLSGGEQQRVGICRAMMLNPKIFLLDEPFGALDVITRNEIQKELLNLQVAEPRTIVLVTHDIDEALKLGDKILILHEGVVQQFSDRYDILKHPANTIVKTYLQSYSGRN